MEYCKYHPIEIANYACSTCHTFNCEDCCNVMGRSEYGVCFLCRNEMTCLGVSNNVVPFWRRLQESFQYPNNFESILFIIGLGVLTAISTYMPFSFLINLLLTSALLKYSFSCLDNTSHGIMKAPDLTDAYGGGFGLALQVIFMVVAIVAAIWATSYFVGNMLATLVAIVLISGFPAMIINFAMTENMFQALNPVRMLHMMAAIGLPYGLLLAFIMIMSGSVGIISEFIGDDFSIVTLTLQSMVGNYYTIVIFHMMGYMIYQYQEELGFETRKVINHDKIQRTVLQKTLSHIDILIKEGQAQEAIKLFAELVQSNPLEKELKFDFFELLLATKDRRQLDDFASQYFTHLLATDRKDLIPVSYKRVLKVNPKFTPDTAEQRVELARICDSRGDSQSVIRLINGLHKSHPDYPELANAYELMANALDNLPNMQVQAQKCRKLIETFK